MFAASKQNVGQMDFFPLLSVLLHETPKTFMNF